jgi:hypothetical protein
MMHFITMLAFLNPAIAQDSRPELFEFRGIEHLDEPVEPDSPAKAKKSTQAGKTDLPIDLGIGIFFNAGGSFMDPFSTHQRAFHLPVLFELSFPKGPVRPCLFGGREFVFPGDPTITQPTGLAMELQAHNKPYGHWAFGFGLEFVLPIDEIDIRIPWTFKGTVDSTWPNRAEELADYSVEGNTVTGIDYLTVWQFHAAVGLGLSVHFL